MVWRNITRNLVMKLLNTILTGLMEILFHNC